MKLPTILFSAVLAAVYPEFAAAEPPVTSNLMVPLEVTVEGADEPILISGTLHIVTQLHQSSLLQDVPSSLEVNTNLVNTTAVGVSTGLTAPITSSQSIRLLTSVDVEDGGTSLLFLEMMVLAENARQDIRGAKNLKLALKQQFLVAQLQFDSLGILTEVEFRDLFLPCNGD